MPVHHPSKEGLARSGIASQGASQSDTATTIAACNLHPSTGRLPELLTVLLILHRLSAKMSECHDVFPPEGGHFELAWLVMKGKCASAEIPGLPFPDATEPKALKTLEAQWLRKS